MKNILLFLVLTLSTLAYSQCPTDLNFDGVTDITDKNIVKGAFGVCTTASCPTDLNYDGVTNDADIAIITANWNVRCLRECFTDLNFDGITDTKDITIVKAALGSKCMPYCPNDLNGDRVVNAADIQLVGAKYGVSCAKSPTDFNNDGITDRTDIDIVNAAYGKPCIPGNCPTDLNSDGVTNVADIMIVGGKYNFRSCPTDLNNDGITNDTDFSIINAAFGTYCPTGNCATDIAMDGITDNNDVQYVKSELNEPCIKYYTTPTYLNLIFDISQATYVGSVVTFPVFYTSNLAEQNTMDFDVKFNSNFEFKGVVGNDNKQRLSYNVMGDTLLIGSYTMNDIFTSNKIMFLSFDTKGAKVKASDFANIAYSNKNAIYMSNFSGNLKVVE